MVDFGLTRDEFLRDFYEKNIFFKRNACSYAPDWSDVDKSLFGWNLADGTLRLFKDGPISPERYMETVLDIGLRRTRIMKDVLYEEMKTGATLLLNRIDLKMEGVNDLANAVARFVGERTVANGYAAFGGKGTFSKHWDTHDVFAVQLIGRKRWRVYAPTMELPLATQQSTHHKHECPAKPLFDECLEAGDVLYIPRGWWHEAIPVENEQTFHVAVGLHVPRLTDYAVWACMNYLGAHLDCRQSIKYEQESIPNIEELCRIVTAEISNIGNFKVYKKQLAADERMESRFEIERAHPGYRPDFSRACVKLNSAYEVNLDEESIMVNGFKINIDEASKGNIKEILARSSEAGSEKSIRLMESLLGKDIMSI